MRRSGALYQVINRKERRRAEARLGNQGRSQAAQQRQLYSGSARDNVGAREQGSERGSHEILLVLGRQTTWAVDHILSTPGLSDDDRIAILGGTAVGLLGIKSSKGRDPQPARQNFRHPDRSQVTRRLAGDRLGQAGGRGYKRNGGSTPCASYHHRRKYVRAAQDRWAPQPRKSARHARKTAKIAHSGGIAASKGARLAMVGFRIDAPCLCCAVLWSVRP